MRVNMKVTFLFLILINSIFHLDCIDETQGTNNQGQDDLRSFSLFKENSLEPENPCSGDGCCLCPDGSFVGTAVPDGWASCQTVLDVDNVCDSPEKLDQAKLYCCVGRKLNSFTSCDLVFDKLSDSDAVLNQTCTGGNTQCVTINYGLRRQRGCFEYNVTNDDKQYYDSSCSETSLLKTGGLTPQIETCNTDNCNTVTQISCQKNNQHRELDRIYYLNGSNVCTIVVPSGAPSASQTVTQGTNDVSTDCPATPLTQYCQSLSNRLSKDVSFVQKGCTTSTQLDYQIYRDAACTEELLQNKCAGNNCNFYPPAFQDATFENILFICQQLLPFFCFGTCITIIIYCCCRSKNTRTTNKSSVDSKKKKKKSSSNSSKKKKNTKSSSNSSKSSS